MYRVLVLLLICQTLFRSAASQCPPNQVTCDGRCVTACDGFMECPDGADETTELCSARECRADTSLGPAGTVDDLSGILDGASISVPSMFRCGYGGCIFNQLVCNGRYDCWDKSDEDPALCAKRSCNKRQFRCTYGACIPRVSTCNGLLHCHDGSDETADQCRTKRCRSIQFQCAYGGCIDKKKTCDGKADCRDASDEDRAMCGAEHNFVTTTLPTLMTPRPGASVTDAVTEPPPVITKPTIVTPKPETCQSRGLCACPPPDNLFCVPCNNVQQTCAQIAQSAVCSTQSEFNAGLVVSVDVLSCGVQPSVVDRDIPLYVCGHRAHFLRPTGVLSANGPQPLWPWLVRLYRHGKYACSGTLITPNYIITAAHCVTLTQEVSRETLDLVHLNVQHLTSGGEVILNNVSTIHLFPGYATGPRPSKDVALLRVLRPVTFSNKVFPACVNSGRFPANDIAATFKPVFTHYHWDMILQKHDPRCHSPQEVCGSILKIDLDQFCGLDIKTNQILPAGSSGGPYLVNVGSDGREHWVVAGLVSSQRTGCDRPYTIFTAVADFWPWIDRCVHQGACA
ncbi:low-density lipoprotein receptor-related protein-like [Penaeus indicus]|uniref:low-density lipoprotein receptor-related protein-like n=1 Tax=Penaeus indicus TaxID=29960 RepID=UPI00300DA931